MPAGNFEILCQRARESIDKRDWEKARQYYLHALALKSDSPDVHYGLATVCFQLKDLRSAAHHFREVTHLDPLRAGAYINLGAVFNLLDQLDDAIPVLRRGIQLDSHRSEGYYNLGLVYRRKGQVDLAIQAYQEALRINPRMADSHYNLANLYLERGQINQAIAHYQQALELRPNWDRAEKGLANAELKLQQRQAEKTGQTPGAVGVRLAVKPGSRPEIPQLDPDRQVDPIMQGGILTSLHEASVAGDECMQAFVKLLETELEPAIKELSTCLLYPDTSVTELEQSTDKLVTAMRSMRALQGALQQHLTKIKTEGEKLTKS
ncbi:MAG TPA: tetratricopeptide repeat protein [Gemmataceae bacterium]|nr:tetratricopeptide repeat protein [Gemmataceae bacterium]